MNCDEVRAQLWDYLDKALDSATIQDVEEHLASCPGCRAEAEQLAGCLRQVATLETVNPPVGFTQQVMARVREIESKPSLWQRLLFPLRIKLPIHATAVILISILAVYLLKTVPPGDEARLSADRAFGILEKKTESGMPGSHREIGGAAAKYETAKETASSKVQVPVSKPQPKAVDQTKAFRANREQSTAFQDRQGLEGKPMGVPPSIATPMKSNLGAGEETGAGGKSLAEKPRSGAAPVASELKGRVTAAEPGASVPSSPAALSGSRTASVPLKSDLRQLQTAADIELIVRRARSSGAQRRDSLGTLDKSAKRESLPPEEAAERVAPLLPAIPESAKTQDVWLTITRAQYDQLKQELLAVGSIESESWLSSREKDSAFRADERLRIKVTVLPPEP